MAQGHVFGALDHQFRYRRQDASLVLGDGNETLSLRPLPEATLLRGRGFRWVNDCSFTR